MEWFPVVFVTFKVVVLGIGMFFAVKWHYDQGKKNKQMERRAVLLATGKAIAIFVLALGALALITSIVLSNLSLDMSGPWW
jgi:heme/copper-type cytochrome/quinol oxidase subunit 2